MSGAMATAEPERKVLAMELYRLTETRTEEDLMNFLQENGLVTDGAEWLRDVASSDLMRARNELMRRKL
jgi:hypothetical protein